MDQLDSVDPPKPRAPSAPSTDSGEAPRADIGGSGVGDERPPIQPISAAPPRSPKGRWVDRPRIRRALTNRKNFSFVAWVAIGTGTVFLALSLPSAAFGAFAVGAGYAYAGRRWRG